MTKLKENETTLIITSCGRVDLLKKTVESILDCAEFEYKIIVEDSGENETIEEVSKLFGKDFIIIANDENIGQIASIDKAYSQVETQYIFHCEDDWEFTRKGFLDESISILKENSAISMVSIRDLENDVSKNCSVEVNKEKKTQNGVKYLQLKPTPGGVYGGYSFNPGLRRTIDYIDNGPFVKIGHEKEISEHFILKKKFMALLKTSATHHIGWERHILSKHNSAEKFYWLKKNLPVLANALKIVKRKIVR